MPASTHPAKLAVRWHEFSAAGPAPAARKQHARGCPFDCCAIGILRWKLCEWAGRSRGAAGSTWSCGSNFLLVVQTQPFFGSRVIIAMQPERLFLVSFSVKIRQQNHVALVEVCGHLTFFEVGALRDSIQKLLQEQRCNILLNLSDLMYLDSSGLGELARIYVTVVKHGGTMKVVGLTAKVQEVLRIARLSNVLQEFPDEQSALRSFPAA
jgi:anti-sigma B factor antagonist